MTSRPQSNQLLSTRYEKECNQMLQLQREPSQVMLFEKVLSSIQRPRQGALSLTGRQTNTKYAKDHSFMIVEKDETMSRQHSRPTQQDETSAHQKPSQSSRNPIVAASTRCETTKTLLISPGLIGLIHHRSEQSRKTRTQALFLSSKTCCGGPVLSVSRLWSHGKRMHARGPKLHM